MKPTVSVLIPCYNDGKYISESIKSVINQTYKDWELIILDDNSTDNCFEIAKSYADNAKIEVFKNDSNLGMLSNWNKGIDLCHSKYFIKLDADDIWHPTMLEEAINILDFNPDVALVFSRYSAIDHKGDKILNSESLPPDFAINKTFDCRALVRLGEEKMLMFDILRQGLSVMRRDVFDSVGKYRYLLTKETEASADTEFYFRLGCHYSIYQSDKILYYYRKHQKSISAQDTMNSLQSRKLFEVKHAIFDYYLKNDIIDIYFYKKELNKVRFRYNSSMFSLFRKKGRILKALKHLIHNVAINPKATLVKNLHISI